MDISILRELLINYPLILTGLLIMSVFVEFSKIKINPWSAIFKWVGDKLNADMNKKLEKYDALLKENQQSLKALEGSIEEVSGKVDTNQAKAIRAEILDFSNSCKNNRKHTKDEFQHIIDIHGDYEKLISKRGITNGILDVEYEFILEVYRGSRYRGTFDCPSYLPTTEQTR